MISFYRGGNRERATSAEAVQRNQIATTAQQQEQQQQQQHDDQSSVAPIPSYLRELAASRVTRDSRASSIVSTATKLSTTTFGEDARSVDLMVGGRYFRIARDGSRITDDAPPPYGLRSVLDAASVLTPPSREHSPGISDLSDNSSVTSRDLRHARYIISSDDENGFDAAEEGAVTPRQRSPFRPGDSALRANILDPTQLYMPSPVDPDGSRLSTALAVDDGGAPVRNLSYKQGPEVLTVTPDARKLHQADFQTRLPDHSATSWATSPLRRRNGVRLPSLETQMLYEAGAATSHQLRPSKGKSQSAGPVLYDPPADDEPRSPDFIGRRAPGVFPRPAMPRSFTTIPAPINFSTDEYQRSPLPLAMDSANDISLHYAGIMRRLDQDHRKEVLFKEKEVGHLRQRLVEMDTVYRQELRARDFIIDDLRARLQHLEEQTEVRIEKARNAIEDIWESRWKAQSFHLWERMRRIEEESQKAVDQILKPKHAATAIVNADGDIV